MSAYNPCKVIEVVNASSRVKVYKLEPLREISATPGQFLMVWLPRVGEIPISVAGLEGGELLLAIARRGKVTSTIHETVGEGSRLYVRGPYGRGFTLKGVRRALLVSGGCGIAPLRLLAEVLNRRDVECTAIAGFNSASEVFFVRDLEAYCSSVTLLTTDGSAGARGSAVDALFPAISRIKPDVIYTCGPELMMVRVVELALAKGVRVEASLERYVKCGIGLCGSCVLEPLGLRVCKDGPGFSGELLAKLKDFGRWWRGADGRTRPIG